MLFQVGQCHGAGEQRQRTAFGVFHPGGGSQGECGGIILELPHELEIAQHNPPCVRIRKADLEGQGKRRPLIPERQRLGFGLGGSRRPQLLGQELGFERGQTGNAPGPNCKFRRRVHDNIPA